MKHWKKAFTLKWHTEKRLLRWNSPLKGFYFEITHWKAIVFKWPLKVLYFEMTDWKAIIFKLHTERLLFWNHSLNVFFNETLKGFYFEITHLTCFFNECVDWIKYTLPNIYYFVEKNKSTFKYKLNFSV